jgi:hypothetical protein
METWLVLLETAYQLARKSWSKLILNYGKTFGKEVWWKLILNFNDLSLSQIDGMLQEFADINRGMEKTGTFTMDKKKLLQLVGKANSNLADVILKVGLFER